MASRLAYKQQPPTRQRVESPAEKQPHERGHIGLSNLPVVMEMFEPACSNCRKKYRLPSGGGGRREGGVLPLLLSCGHTFCSSCLDRLAKLKPSALVCPACQEPTPFSSSLSVSSQLSPCYAVLGMMVAKEYGLKSPIISLTTTSLTNKSERLYMPKAFQPSRSVPQCEECDNRPADVRCSKCSNLYCNQCFQQIHSSSRTLRLHVPVPFEEEVMCVSHPSSPSTAYCYQCSTLICDVCSDDHSDHETSTITTAIGRLKRQVEPLMSSAQLVQDKLGQAETDLMVQSRKLNEVSRKFSYEIRDHFINLSAAIQLREHMMMTELSRAHGVHCQNLAGLVQRVRKDFQLVMVALSQWDDHSNTTLLTKYTEMVKDLSQLEGLSCRLKKDRSATQMSVRYDHEVSRLIKEICSVEVGQPQFCLVGIDEDDDEGGLESLLSSESSVSPMKDSSSDTKLSSSPRKYVPLYGAAPDGGLGTGGKSGGRKKQRKKQLARGSATAATLDLNTSSYSSRSVSPQPSQDNTVPVTVSHVESPSEFWVQTVTSAKLSTLQQAITNHCQSASPMDPALITPGLHCAASISDLWYRVEVDTVQQSTPPYASVFRIDYGTTEVVSLSSLYPLPRLKQPAAATKCCLAGIEPTSRSANLAPVDWSQHALSFFRTYALSQSGVTMKVESVNELSGVSNVHLYTSGGTTSLADELVMRGQAKRITPPTVTMVQDPWPLPVGQSVNVIVPCLEAPDDLYVQQVSACALISNLSIAIDTEQAKSRPPTVPLKPGMLVCALYSFDKIYYRAKVIACEDDVVSVQFIDYGNTDMVDSSKVFLPKLKLLLNTPPQATHVCLANVLPLKEDWPLEVTTHVAMLLEGEIAMTVLREGQFVDEGSPLPVKMVDQQGQDIASIMVTTDLARYASRTPSSSPPPSPSSSSSSFKQKRDTTLSSPPPPSSSSEHEQEEKLIPDPLVKLFSNPQTMMLPISHSSDDDSTDTLSLDNFHLSSLSPPPPCSPPLGKTISAIITHASSPTDFYICTSSPVKLQQHLNALSPLATSSFTITSHMFCCAKFFTDNRYHRVLVLGPAAKEASWEVLFVDYGNTEVVSTADLVPLTDLIATFPMLAFQCKLFHVKPVTTSWTQEGCSFFLGLVLNKEIHITLEASPNKVSITVDKMDIADMLCSAGHARLSDDSQ